MSFANADQEREEFSRRLHQALVAAGIGVVSAANLRREYNLRADGARVSIAAARKWLAGESIPTQEKLHILAKWLGISAEWLRFGEDGTRALAAQLETGHRALPATDRVFLDDLHSLNSRDQQLLRAILDAFLNQAQN